MYHFCPFARQTRESGRLGRAVLEMAAPDETALVAAIRAWEAREEIEIALLLLPCLAVDASAFEHFVSGARERYAREARQSGGRQRFFAVAFHPELEVDVGTPARAVSLLRRAPDPTVQLVRVEAIDRARQLLGSDASEAIGRENHATIRRVGAERLLALLAALRA